MSVIALEGDPIRFKDEFRFDLLGHLETSHIGDAPSAEGGLVIHGFTPESDAPSWPD